MQLAYVFVLNTTPEQEQAFRSHAGAARFAFNWGVATVEATAKARDQVKADGGDVSGPEWDVLRDSRRHFALCKLWTAYKNAHAKVPDEQGRTTEWVGENFSGTYQAALRDAATAYKNFWESVTGKRRGRRVGRPKFKSRRRARESFQLHGEALRVVDAHRIQLPKIGVVRTWESTRKLLRRLRHPDVQCLDCAGAKTVTVAGRKAGEPDTIKPCPGCRSGKVSTGMTPFARIVRATVALNSRGRWQVSLTVELHRQVRTGPSARQRAGGTVGLDLGTRDLVTVSDGRRVAAPRYLDGALLRRLARRGKALSRAQMDSARWVKARERLRRVHGRIANLRLDHTHKLSTALVHAHECIVVEGWDLAAAAQSGSKRLPREIRRRRNRQLADAAPGMLRWQLATKAAWYGATVVVTPPFEATGRSCSACGTVRVKPVPPGGDQFECASCGHTSDRRLNTARWLAKYGRDSKPVAPSGGETKNARGEGVRPGSKRRVPSSRPRRPSLKREAGSSRGESGTPGP